MTSRRRSARRLIVSELHATLRRVKKLKIITQHNLWFTAKGANYRIGDVDMIPVEPALGRTDSSDQASHEAELGTMREHLGRSGKRLIIAQQWIRPDDRIDKNLRSAWLPALEANGRKARWMIFYDSKLALMQRGFPPTETLATPDGLQLWKEDIEYFRRNYFDHPNYLHIDGRPAIYVWALHGIWGDSGVPYDWARDNGVFVMGDVFGRADGIVPGGVEITTGFVSALPGGPGGTVEYRDALSRLVSQWTHYAEFWPTVPAASLQYDDAQFQKALEASGRPSMAATQILAGGLTDLSDMLEAMKLGAMVNPHPDLGPSIFLGTMNNWAEGTTLLPTVSSDNPFPGDRIGNYGFEHLRAVGRILS